jgi:hypothetical protein
MSGEDFQSAKDVYDEKILLSLVGNDFPSMLQNTCINSIKYKSYFYPDPKHKAWTGNECEDGVASNKLAYCERCVVDKYMRNFNDTV